MAIKLILTVLISLETAVFFISYLSFSLSVLTCGGQNKDFSHCRLILRAKRQIRFGKSDTLSPSCSCVVGQSSPRKFSSTQMALHWLQKA